MKRTTVELSQLPHVIIGTAGTVGLDYTCRESPLFRSTVNFHMFADFQF